MDSKTEGAGRGALRFKTRSAVSLVAMLAALSGCTTADMKLVDSTMPHRDTAVNQAHANADTPPVIVLESNPNEFWTLEYDRGDALPVVPVGPIKAEGVTVDGLLDILANAQGIGIIKSDELITRGDTPPAGPGAAAAPAAPPVISYSDPQKRPFKDIVETICSRTGLFYEYRSGMLSFERIRRFSVRVPRIGDSRAMFVDAFGKLGATNVIEDKISGIVSFKADYRTYLAAKAFMKKFEEGHDMIVFDIWVFERKLTDDQEQGAYFNKLTGRLGAPTNFSLKDTLSAAGAFQMGLVSQLGGTAIDMVISLLNKEGATETIERPQIAMMSGGESSFAVGEKQQYISQVTTVNVANTTASGSSSATTTPEQSVNVDTLETGIKMKLKAAHNDGIISSDFDLTLNTLIEFTSFDTGTVKLTLPHTANRDMKTSIDARPGDLIILSGLIQGQGSENTTGFIKDLPIVRTAEKNKDEVIFLMRPRLVKIRPAGTKLLPGEILIHAGTGRLEMPAQQSDKDAAEKKAGEAKDAKAARDGKDAKASAKAAEDKAAKDDKGSKEGRTPPPPAPTPPPAPEAPPSAEVRPADPKAPVVLKADPWWGGGGPPAQADSPWRRHDDSKAKAPAAPQEEPAKESQP